jgi:hypothetical protein
MEEILVSWWWGFLSDAKSKIWTFKEEKKNVWDTFLQNFEGKNKE